jgi:hypothetical protein
MNFTRFFALTVLFAGHAFAQGAYGYTSIDFDSSSNQVIGYSETDLDPELLGYYAATIVARLYGPDGIQIVYATATDQEDVGEIDVILVADGSPGSNYTVTGQHQTVNEIYDCPGSCGYEDYYDLIYFPSLNIDADLEYDFFSPAPSPQRTNGPTITLGRTTDSATLITPPACGDERDAAIAEYSTYHVGLRPNCSDFTQSTPSTNFSFSTLNSGNYSWAILRSYLGTNLDAIFPNAPAMVMTSGYRNPAKQHAVNPSTPNSRHSFGDAVDIATYNSLTSWGQMHSAAKQWGTASGSPCFEPYTVSTTNHLHVDWRPLASCSTAWRQ